MKRRLFLRSLWQQSVALPSAYLLSTALGPRAKAQTFDAAGTTGENSADASPDELLQNRGCGKDTQGIAKPTHGSIARDFHDPYLELIRLLKEASEIEHALMIQYLFAAFSLKPQYQALVGATAATSDGLLSIAIQEMQHLAVVNKLLVALGGSPNLRRQDFPYEPDIYPFPMSLQPLSRRSAARYAYAEAGRDSMQLQGDVSPADQLFCNQLTEELGDDTGMNHIAGLYSIIIDHITQMEKAGTLKLTDYDAWMEKLQHIMVQGEIDHFHFFRKLFVGEHPAFAERNNPWDHSPDHPDYPSYALPANPSAYLGHENQIPSSTARELAWLSNLHYWMVLMLLDYYYRTGGESVNAMAQVHMVGPLQTLARKLTELGTGLPFDVLSLGYSPAPEAAGNLRFIQRLSREAYSLAQKLKPTLPADYPIDIDLATSELIKAELKIRDQEKIPT